MKVFLCGDVMLGRGIDQILPSPGNPEIFEDYMQSALGYVRLAEKKHGPLRLPVDFAYVWGDAIAEMERMGAEARIINLETSITSDGRPWPGKGINYRMHPGNGPCLQAAGIDVCVLANNHTLDWDREGLRETLETLDRLGIGHAGAGADWESARRPAVVPMGEKRRVLVFAFGSESSGIPTDWEAREDRSGLHVLETRLDFLGEMRELLAAWKRDGDVAIASVHWGGNWGYQIPDWQAELAHALVEEAGFDMVHGHSSHHVKGIEVRNGRPILYGCGDFLNDYEGISGYEEFRSDLGLMYFPEWDDAGRLAALRMSPMRIRRFQVTRAGREDAQWLEGLLNREGRPLGTRVELAGDGTLELRWK